MVVLRSSCVLPGAACHDASPELCLQDKSGDVFNRLGSFAWLAAAILGAELLNVAKLGRGEFTAPFPDHIKLAWSVAGGLFVLFLAGWQAKLWTSRYVKSASPPGVLRAKKSKAG